MHLEVATKNRAYLSFGVYHVIISTGCHDWRMSNTVEIREANNAIDPALYTNSPDYDPDRTNVEFSLTADQMGYAYITHVVQSVKSRLWGREVWNKDDLTEVIKWACEKARKLHRYNEYIEE